MTAPAVRGVGTVTDDAINAASQSLPVPIPAGSQVGDTATLIVIAQTGSAGAAIMNTPAGWTVAPHAPTASTNAFGRINVWTKTLTSGDISAGVVNVSSSATSGSFRAIGDCVVTEPATLDNDVSTNGAGNVSPPHSSGSITASADGLAVLVIGGATRTGGLAGENMGTPPAGLTEQSDLNSGHASLRNAFGSVDTGNVSAGTVGPYQRSSKDAVGSDDPAQIQTWLGVLVASGGGTPPEIHTTTGSATGIRSTTAVTSTRRITARNAAGIRSTTAVTSTRRITARNAAGVRSTSYAVTTLRTTTGSAPGVRSATSSTNHVEEGAEVHYTIGTAASVHDATAAVSTVRTTAGDAVVVVGAFTTPAGALPDYPHAPETAVLLSDGVSHAYPTITPPVTALLVTSPPATVIMGSQNGTATLVADGTSTAVVMPATPEQAILVPVDAATAIIDLSEGD
jgi:hypothetical protein